MNQIFTTPFEWIAVWLRKLSLSGNSGNCIAIILYIIICCLPAIAFLLLCLRKKKIRADYLLLVCMPDHGKNPENDVTDKDGP